MESSRVVEVLHDRGSCAQPRWLIGSGFVVKSGVVLTADHNLCDLEEAGEQRTYVRTMDGAERAATVTARSDTLDLALLTVADLKASPVRMGLIDRENINVLRDVSAAGFPNFKYSHDRPPATARQPAQPVGFIPSVEGYTAGKLTLKVEAGEPAPSPQSGSSPWEGLSGGGVFAGELLLGVVIEHDLSEGLGSLQLMPLARVLELTDSVGVLFRAILGIDDVTAFEALDTTQDDSGEDPVLRTIVRELELVMSLGDRGLLTSAEVTALKLTAYKEAKGWR